jgi:MinD-like ATPase involved in chromosome partitioning or flagellar assembly
MPAGLIALLVFVVAALMAFGMGSILDQRSARTRLIKERLSNERKAPELAPDEELALLRDEQLSQIPALDELLRRSDRVTDIQKMLAQAGMATRAGTFLGISILASVVATLLAYALSKRVEVAWVAMLVGFVLPYSYVSYRRNKRGREFIELPTNTTDLLEALARLTRAQRWGRQEIRGKVFSVINAKGGNGATTVAVNLALALQSVYGQTALVDLAPLGHAALHLNLKPPYSVWDAIRNHRMDSSLLESLMTRHNSGLQLLAGTNAPAAVEPSTAEVARLFDMLVRHYKYVVVDYSSRLDAASRLDADLSEYVLLVACMDVVSLWSAARVAQYLGETGNRERLRLILNRFRQVPGMSESDVENVTGVKVLWRIPNEDVAISSAIDRGTPVMEQNNEIARCFYGLAQELIRNHADDA